MNLELCRPETIDAVQLLGLAIAAGWALFLFHQSQRLQRAQIYKDLEFRAIDLFVMALEEPKLNAIYETDPEKTAALSEEERSRLRDYAYCVLNLFELMFNLQERRLVTDRIFSTWAPWIFEFSRGAFSRNLWKEEACWHYSGKFGDAMRKVMSNPQGLKQVRRVFADMHLMKRDDLHSGAQVARRRAKLMARQWRQIRSRVSGHAAWYGRKEAPARSGAALAGTAAPQLGWAFPVSEAAEYVDFFVRNTDPSFISFGEIIDGRADGPGHWSRDLRDVLTQEIQEALAGSGTADNSTRVFDARNEEGALLGYALVSIDKASRQPNAWLEDVIVDAGQRGKRLGCAMIQAIEAELCRDPSLRHIFLESSTAKADAHRFFRRLGYREVAVVMMKPIPTAGPAAAAS